MSACEPEPRRARVTRFSLPSESVWARARHPSLCLSRLDVSLWRPSCRRRRLVLLFNLLGAPRRTPAKSSRDTNSSGAINPAADAHRSINLVDAPLAHVARAKSSWKGRATRGRAAPCVIGPEAGRMPPARVPGGSCLGPHRSLLAFRARPELAGGQLEPDAAPSGRWRRRAGPAHDWLAQSLLGAARTGPPEPPSRQLRRPARLDLPISS